MPFPKVGKDQPIIQEMVVKDNFTGERSEPGTLQVARTNQNGATLADSGEHRAVTREVQTIIRLFRYSPSPSLTAL